MIVKPELEPPHDDTSPSAHLVGQNQLPKAGEHGGACAMEKSDQESSVKQMLVEKLQ